MSKTVTINQDKLLMLKETVASDSNITSHNDYCSELTEAAPEVDEYEIGDEGSNPPVGGNFYHVNESTSFDTSEIGGVNYSWDFDEEEYQEWLVDAEYENTQEALMEYINDNVEFELEYLDNETYHTCGCDYVDYDTLEELFGAKMQSEILRTCMSDGSGSFDVDELFSEEDVDINDQNSVNNMAMKLLRHGDYFKDCRGFILTNGVVVYTESEHNEICRIPNVNDKFDFIRMGNIRVLPQSIDIGTAPTSEQRDVLRKAIASYANEELYLDIYQGKSSIGAKYIQPDWRYVMGEIDRFFSEGIKPQGNEFYESKKIQITENESDKLSDYDKSILYLKISEEQLTKKMAEISNKYGCDIKFFISNTNQGVIQADQNDIQKFKTFGVERRNIYEKIKKIQETIKRKEQEKKNLEDWESRKKQLENDYDVISLAIEEFGLTSTLSQAGYILPDGRLLNFGRNGVRGSDHREIEGIYKENNISIWSDEYRYNYVVDFMNHGAIRCDVYSGILDMTQEPTNEQYSVIKTFVRKAVDVDIDFTDNKGNTLHSVSYSNAKPQAVVADIMRYYEDGIKPMGNVQYEEKDKNGFVILEDKRTDQARLRCKEIIRNYFKNANWLDTVFEHQDNPQGMTYLDYMLYHFEEEFYHDPNLRKGATMRLEPLFCKLAFENGFQQQDPNVQNLQRLSAILNLLYNMSKEGKINLSKIDIMNTTFEQLNNEFGKIIDDTNKSEAESIRNMTFNKNNDYTVVGPLDYKEAEEIGNYSNPDGKLCYTQSESTWDDYTKDGLNNVYAILKNGWQYVEAVHDDESNSAYDTYGLSMVFVFVDENGELAYCNTRWNHDAEYKEGFSVDHAMSKTDISKLIGANFFEVFKPNNKWKDLLTSVMQRLENGEDPSTIFDDVCDFSEGFARVKLNGKYNFINQERMFLSDKWFDYAGDFSEGFARVKLNGKYNFINQEGRFLSDQWFDAVGYFIEGFAVVKLNDKWNFINQEGRLISDQWFDYVDDFYNGFADVKLNGKHCRLDTNGNLAIAESKNKNKKIVVSENQLRILKENTFESWFGNSILRDEDGKPLKMYHGTDSEFDTFSKEHIGRTGAYEGYGFNFTPFESRARGYNSINVIEAYLKVENPMTTKSHKITLNKLIKIISELDKGKPFTDTIVAAYEPARYNEKWDAMYYRRALPITAKIIYNYNKENNYGDAGLYAEICLCGQSDKIETINVFERLGYDSAIFYDNNDRINTVIVFEPNQIKKTSNKTFNIDSDSMNEQITNENFDFEVDSSEIDLSSFKKKHELVPNIWNPDGTLNSRVRLKLLDIADDFWEYVNLTWVKPSGIILTGSICNFNWSQYSDIDLHLIVDFDEIDEKTEFVRDYLDAKKNEWNNEHNGLQIMGYPVELYVQNLEEMPESSGIYDLEENDWVREPNPDDIKSIGLNKFSIKKKAAKIMTIIDDMYNTLASTDDSHKIEQMGDDANYLWKKVKEMRKSSLEKNGESGSGNIVYKYMRRKGYLDKLWNLRTICYDKSNSITEGIRYDNFRNSQMVRYKVVADMAEDGYVFHGTGEDGNGVEWDTVDQTKIKGGSRATYGYGIYFTDHAYKCEKYTTYEDGHYIIANIKDFEIIDLEERINKYYNIFIEKQKEYYILQNELENARNNRDYDRISSMIEEYNNTVDKKLLNAIIEVIEKSDENDLTYFYLNDNIPLLWYSDGDPKKQLSELYLSLGIDGFKYDTEFVIFNFDKLNKSIVKDKEILIDKYIQKSLSWFKDKKIYVDESVKKYITLLKENLISEETVADGSSNGNPYKDRWKAERQALKNYVCNYGTVMQSKEDDKGGKLYKVFYDKGISELIGYNYALCVQWDEIQMKPKSIVYIRALDKFTPNIRRNIQYDTRGFDNVQGTYDDRRY